MKNKPITIGKVTYTSLRQAAEALGVTECAVSIARRRGKLEWLGVNKGNNPPKKRPIKPDDTQ